MKSQPLAYNKDNREDKEPLFDPRGHARRPPEGLCGHDPRGHGPRGRDARGGAAQLLDGDGPRRLPRPPGRALPRRPRRGRPRRGPRPRGGLRSVRARPGRAAAFPRPSRPTSSRCSRSAWRLVDYLGGWGLGDLLSARRCARVGRAAASRAHLGARPTAVIHSSLVARRSAQRPAIDRIARSSCSPEPVMTTPASVSSSSAWPPCCSRRAAAERPPLTLPEDESGLGARSTVCRCRPAHRPGAWTPCGTAPSPLGLSPALRP